MYDYFSKTPFLNEKEVVKGVGKFAIPLHCEKDLQPLLDRIGDARIVMLGEASHGTHEYYTWRTYLTKRLIEEKGFQFIAVEGDWPDCYALNRYVKGHGNAKETAVEVLQSFRRWPAWMWANWETATLIEWLKTHNAGLTTGKMVGFYGLDMYSLRESLEYIHQYLKHKDPDALDEALDAFRFVEPYMRDERGSYAFASQMVPGLREEEILQMLKSARQKPLGHTIEHENAFGLEQNALVALNAERYYRVMLKGGVEGWNIRDRHMADTLERLMRFHSDDAKVVVWGHNTHIGDARFTDMEDEGMSNLGQMMRSAYGKENVALVGFGSYQGTVIAAPQWSAPMQVMQMPPARIGSWEYLLHLSGAHHKLLLMNDFAQNGVFTQNQIGHRAVGVVYHPEYERKGNYIPSVLPWRYDAFVYLEETRALRPLPVRLDRDQIPDTFPFGV